MDHGHCGLSLSCIIIYDSMKVGPMRNCILEGCGAVDLGPGHVCLSVTLNSMKVGPMRNCVQEGSGANDLGPGHVCLPVNLDSMKVGPMRSCIQDGSIRVRLQKKCSVLMFTILAREPIIHINTQEIKLQNKVLMAREPIY